MNRDPTTRFTDRVNDYVLARPSYPAALHAVLVTDHGLQPEHVIADVGSGTGKLAALFVAGDHQVIGIEPNAAMRGAAEELFCGQPRFVSADGTAEATGLSEASADWVVAGQAFHWFDPPRARAEFTRILRPPRPVALAWNDRDTVASELMAGYEALLGRHGTDYAEVNHQKASAEPVTAFFGSNRCTQYTFLHDQVLDRDGLRHRLLSSSYVPAPGEPGHDAMLSDLEELFTRHESSGEVRFIYRARLHVGRL